jgi:hypothetical protein
MIGRGESGSASLQTPALCEINRTKRAPSAFKQAEVRSATPSFYCL